MKELTIQEKAQRYDEALERAKTMQEKSNGMILKKWLWGVFPELKESEDERIRKCICLCLEECVHNDIIRDYEKDKCLAWLEKQCQVKESLISQLKNKTCKENDDSLTSEDERMRKAIYIYLDWLEGRKDYAPKGKYSIRDMLAWLEKQGKQKTPIWKHWKDGIAGNGDSRPTYLIKYGHIYSLSSCLCFECDYIELLELDKFLSEKQGEQKPAWSEEDEKRVHRISDFIWKNRKGDTDEIYQQEQDVNWLKSLRLQNRWKPSDEQMTALRRMKAAIAGEGEIYKPLNSLYEDLKKLREE